MLSNFEINDNKKAGRKIPAFFIISKREDQLFLICFFILILQGFLQIREEIFGPIVLTALLYSFCVIVTKFISEIFLSFRMMATAKKKISYYILSFLYLVATIGMTSLIIFYSLEGFTPYADYGIRYLNIEKQDYIFFSIFILFLCLYPFARKERAARKIRNGNDQAL